MPTFRERLSSLLDEMQDINPKIRRRDFADVLGAPLYRVNAWLDDNGRPDYETLKFISKNAGVSAAWLIGETESRDVPIMSHTKSLPEEAQKELHYVMDYLQFKYGMRSTD